LEEMIDRYKHTRKMLRAIRTLNTDKYEREVIGGMISDCQFVIEWLGTGRRPGNMRGIERRAAYQREKLMDPLRMQAFMSNSTAGSPANITESERSKIEAALCTLSKRERECYELHHGMCYSLSKVAELLGIHKASAQSYIQSAKRKIEHEKLNSLFLI
jgi:DNA-binding CsgD family transcriptional regulator